MFEVFSVYSPTAVGPYTKGTLRRPAAEHTLYNKNVAIVKLQYNINMWVFSYDSATWNSLMASHGLTPSNTTDPSDPQGIANLIWEKVFTLMTTDGFNALGDHGGVLYNRLNFSDYTNYKPVNFPIPNPMIMIDNWQPNLVQNFAPCTQSGQRIFPRIQTFITPQLQYTKPFLVTPSTLSTVTWNAPQDTADISYQLYKDKTNQVIDTLKNLTDTQKMISEFFEAKLFSLGLIGNSLFNHYYPDNLDKYTQFEIVVNSAIFDVITSVWGAKAKFNSVRPYSAVRTVYWNFWQKKNITSYAGPFQGTQTFPANQWASYLNTDAHPEYPSGTACVCSAWASAARQFFGSDYLNFTIVFQPGTSVIEPGLTPAAPVSVTWATLTDMENDCGASRNWGGVHFLASIAEAQRVCPGLSNDVITNLNKLMNGDASWLTWM
eukprot:TRINITY_DN1425_c0_g2_i5.p1 TRINITY_DN1425_c0_g2~~TRINITY_DN1425_c0_g2_i5.p1  ORF type:complete len:504 (+),score=107.48 TRINITY_DN1425_c0_g2_i5:213-1514(+)